MQSSGARGRATGVLSSNTHGKARKRASKACLSCRARKVRCDVSQRGRPCMNCYLDSEACVVTGRASRLRRARDDEMEQEASHPPYDFTGNGNGNDGGNIVIQPADAVFQTRLDHVQAPRDLISSCSGHHPSPPGKTCPAWKAQCSRSDGGSGLGDSARANASPARAMQTPVSVGHERRNASATSASSTNPLADTCTSPADSPDVVYSYYPFLVVSNLPNIPVQDVNFLDSQMCLRVPRRCWLDEFLKQYFLHVHPLLPLIDEAAFWTMCNSINMDCRAPRGQEGCLSLLVLQAILFASCTFVSRPAIRALGFADIRAARASLYRRAKLLHDFETESSPLALSQACLLLSFWSPSSTRKPNTSWLSLAIQHAKSAEAHHYAAMPRFSAASHSLQHRKQNILKRLWWCCIIRDRCLGLLMRRPLQITKAHFDFDSSPAFDSSDLAGELGASQVYNAETKGCLAEILAQVVQLYVALTDILLLVFPLDDTPGWGRKMTDNNASSVSECKKALRRWYKDATLRFPMVDSRAAPDSSSLTPGLHERYNHESCILYTNLMYMYYHSARVVLGHYDILHLAGRQTVPGTDEHAWVRDLSVIYENRHELQDAASGVTECLKELVHLKLARWLPISAVACTALPLMLNILDVKLSSQTIGSDLNLDPNTVTKQHRLNILIEAMRTYQPQYDGVDWVSEIVRHIVTLAQIDSPEVSRASVGSSINDWTDILALQPSSYLRLALALDLSLSKGRLPEDGDFPVSLRGLFTGGYSPLKTLVEVTELDDVDAVHVETDACSTSREPHWSRESSSRSRTPSFFNPTSPMPCVNPTRAAASPPEVAIDSIESEVTAGVDSPSTAGGYEGMYMDGPLPDISTVWIENLWEEMDTVQNRTDRDTARILLEALREGDMA